MRDISPLMPGVKTRCLWCTETGIHLISFVVNLPYRHCREFVDGIHLVGDDEIITAVQLFEAGLKMPLKMETSGAAGAAQQDDVIKWKHFPRYWAFVRGIHRPTVNSPHKGQWRGALMISLICVWTNWPTVKQIAGMLVIWDTVACIMTSL